MTTDATIKQITDFNVIPSTNKSNENDIIDQIPESNEIQTKSECYFKDCNWQEWHIENKFSRSDPMIYYDVLYKNKIIKVCEGLDWDGHRDEFVCFACGDSKCFLTQGKITGDKYSRFACQKHMQEYKCQMCGKYDHPNIYGNDYNFSHCNGCDTEICNECMVGLGVKDYKKEVDKCLFC